MDEELQKRLREAMARNWSSLDYSGYPKTYSGMQKDAIELIERWVLNGFIPYGDYVVNLAMPGTSVARPESEELVSEELVSEESEMELPADFPEMTVFRVS